MNNQIPDYMTTVVLDCTGEKSKSKWIGQFKVKCVLTHGDRLAIERMYAELLPVSVNMSIGNLTEGEAANNEKMRLLAATIAELSVRIMEGPEWWRSSRYGQLLIDEEPVYELLILCNKASQDWTDQLDRNATFTEEEANLVEPKKQTDIPITRREDGFAVIEPPGVAEKTSDQKSSK